MKNEFTDPRHYEKERNTSDHLKGRACNGCKFMTVLDRKKKSVLYGKLHQLYYEEYYCNKKGRVLKTAEIPRKCEGRRS